jgi:hypothetical protein
MKKFLALVGLLIIGAGFKSSAQNFPIDTTTKRIDYTAVVPMVGQTKDQLFDQAMKVLHKMYPNADQKLAVADRSAGKIVLNGFTRVMLKDASGVMVPDPTLIRYKLTILFKDGKYKYEITEFVIEKSGMPWHVERWIEHNNPGDHTYDKGDRVQEHLDFLYSDIKRVIKELTDGMKGEKEVIKKDW